MCASDLPLWQLNEAHLFSTVPLPLSQGVLLSLVQQLGCDLDKDTTRKLSWIREAALALNPDDPLLAPHMRPFLHQLHQNLLRQMEQTTVSGDQTTVPGEQSNLRLVIHVVRSLLTSCKQWGRCWRILAAAEERGRADPIRKIHKGWSKRRRTRCPRLGSCLVRFRCAWESPRALELVMSVNMEWWWKLGGGGCYGLCGYWGVWCGESGEMVNTWVSEVESFQTVAKVRQEVTMGRTVQKYGLRFVQSRL